MNKKGFIIEMIIGIGLIIFGFFWFANSNGMDNGLEENKTIVDVLEGELEDYMEESCVPASCCHATTCVDESLAPDCSDILCTMSCEPDTMDCGQGSCKWENGNCEVEWT
jgi:hypothetical protein